MNMQALLIRAAVLLVMCLGLSIAVTRQTPAQASLQPVPAMATPRLNTATMPLPIVVLPTITVRPSAAEIAAAMSGETTQFDAAPTFIETAREQPILDNTVSLRSLRLDMPYYSFGKVLPRVSKE